MFDIGWSEMLLTLAIAVLVIGPKELPHALYTTGKFIRKIKLFTGDIQKSLNDVMQDAELDEIVREANKVGGKNLQFEIDRQIQLEVQKNDTIG